MTTPLRSELTELPRRLKALPVDARGYPVPWFVAWHDGVPDFRIADTAKWRRAVRERRCWVCGDRLGRYLAFVIGPMCGINRTTTEPPLHRECAEWSVMNCPFLVRPHAKRRENGITADMRAQSAGDPILRNPGVTLLWMTDTYRIFRDGNGRPLIEIGDPSALAWYAEGRPATRAEVAASVDSGLPLLLDVARRQDAAEGCNSVAELTRRYDAFKAHYPAAS